MWRRVPVCLALVLASVCRADEPRTPAPRTLDQLHQEIIALETLHYLRFTPAQLGKAKDLARDASAKAPPASKSKVSKELREALQDLHAALIAANDDERIEELTDKVEELVDVENVAFADDFEVTDLARERASRLLKALTARQVAAYLGGMEEDLPDPRELLIESLAKARTFAPAKWKEYRDEIGDRVGFLVAGLDAAKAQKINDQVVQMLIIVRSLSADEFKNRQAELEKKAQDIAGSVGPMEVLRHIMENALAELLSNPRLPAALESRSK